MESYCHNSRVRTSKGVTMLAGVESRFSPTRKRKVVDTEGNQRRKLLKEFWGTRAHELLHVGPPPYISSIKVDREKRLSSGNSVFHRCVIKSDISGLNVQGTVAQTFRDSTRFDMQDSTRFDMQDSTRFDMQDSTRFDMQDSTRFDMQDSTRFDMRSWPVASVTIHQREHGLIIRHRQVSKQLHTKVSTALPGQSSSSPNRLNKYLETAHYPSDCRRYQNVYPHQYANRVERIKVAYADLNRRLKMQGKREKVKAVARWSIEHADKMFPNICGTTHCVPPVFVNEYGLKEHADCSRKCGAPVFKTRSSESDVRGSNSNRIVVEAFQRLSYHLERRGRSCLFLVSDYSYDNYLRWVRDPRHLCHEHGDWFRRLEPDASMVDAFRHDSNNSEPCIGFPENAGVQRHKTDLIVFHENKGIVMVQIKSIGGKETPRETVKRKVEECISKQLELDSRVLRVLVQPDRAPEVTQVLALPNISAEELSTLGLDNSLTSGVTFLLKDNLPDVKTGVPGSQTGVRTLHRWFKGLPDRPVPVDMIKELVGRFVGILSMPIDLLEVNERSRVRDYCDATLFVGRLFRRLVLTEQQISILRTHESSKRVYLSGPPGSGKTLLLITRARMFVEMSEQHQVVVLNLYRGAKGRAIGALIAQALCFRDLISGRPQALNGGRIRHVRLDINDIDSDDDDDNIIVKTVREELPEGVAMENVMFLIDEVFIKKRWQNVWAPFTTSFKDSTVWCAGIDTPHPDGLPLCQTISLDLVLRCPPAVQNVLHRTDWDEKRRALYTGDSNRPELASNGPTPLCVRHERHQVGVAVTDCSQCAEELACLLRDTLGLVGRSQTDDASPSNGTASAQSPALLPCDVVVLYNVPRQEFRRTNCDSAAGEVELSQLTASRFQLHAQKLSTCRFFDTLKDKLKNTSLRLIDRLDDEGLEGSGSWKEIVISWVDIVQGLEKDIVIFLPGDLSPKDCSFSTEKMSTRVKLYQTIGTEESSSVMEFDASKKEKNMKKSFGVKLDVPHALSRDEEKEPSRTSATETVRGSNSLTKTRTCELPVPGLSRDEPVTEPQPKRYRASSGTQRELTLFVANKISNGGDSTSREEHQNEQAATRARGLADMVWRSEDIDRYSVWDQTNLFLAASRCCAQLIMLVP